MLFCSAFFLLELSFYRLIIDWLLDWLIGRSVGWSFGWLIESLFEQCLLTYYSGRCISWSISSQLKVYVIHFDYVLQEIQDSQIKRWRISWFVEEGSQSRAPASFSFDCVVDDSPHFYGPRGEKPTEEMMMFVWLCPWRGYEVMILE